MINWSKEMTASVPSAFQAQIKRNGDKDMLAEKDSSGEYVAKTYRQVGEEVRNLSLGLAALGVQPRDHVALMMSTQPNWVISDLAILSANAVNVPVYPTNKGELVSHPINNAGAKLAIAGSEEVFQAINEVWNDIPDLKTLIVPDGGKNSGTIKEVMENLPGDKEILEMQEVKEMGKKKDAEEPGLFEERWTSIDKHDLCSIIYTSGTTGLPKGVMLTHDNFLVNVRQMMERVNIEDHFINFSFLPLSHVLERTVGYYLSMCAGLTIYYAESMDTLADDLAKVAPHHMVSVPRIYERIYDRLVGMMEEEGGLKKKLFYKAEEVGREYSRYFAENKEMPFSLKFKYNLYDKLVLKKVRERFGGRLRYTISGGAPLGVKLSEFFVGLGLSVMEGYGLTETSPVITHNLEDRLKHGSVGTPAPWTEVAIAEDGEIKVKGPQVFQGYYNNPEATAEVLEDGWFYTGDIGYIDEDNFLFITDRKKDLIITAGGKNVAPQPIEGVLVEDRYIAQVVTQGDKQKFLAAVVVPNFENLEEYAKEQGIQYNNRSELINNEQIKQFYARRVGMLLQHLPSHEQIKRIKLREEEFTMENKELTPTLKIKRRFIFEKYKHLFEDLYSEDGDFIKVEL